MSIEGDRLAADRRSGVLRRVARFACAAGALIAASLFVSCTREAAQPMRIAMNVWPGYEPLFLARHHGKLAEPDYRLVEFSNAAEVGRAFRNGSVEAACLTLDEVFYLQHAGADPVVVLVMDESHGGDAVVARPDVRTLGDLRGKRIGVEISAVGTYMLTRTLQHAGLGLPDVTVVQLPNEKQVRAFQSGAIDAVVTFEPVRSQLLALGGTDIFNSARLPGEIVDVLAVQRAYANAHPERIAALRRAWFDALERLRRAPAESAAIMAPREQMSAESFTTALSGLRFPDHDENRAALSGPKPRLLESATRLQAVMRDSGLLSADLPLDLLFTGPAWDGSVATDSPH